MNPDKNVEAIRQKLLDRSNVGLTKYCTTTERTDIDFVGWLIHLQEELMDGAIYAQAAMVAHEQEIRKVRARLARVEAERDCLMDAILAWPGTMPGGAMTISEWCALSKAALDNLDKVQP